MKTEVYKLKDICSIKSGKRIPLGMDFTTEITNHPYIRARDIKGGKIQTDDLIYLDDAVYKKIQRYIINSGDVAITIVGASVGDVSYAQDEVDGYNLTENAVRLTNFSNKVKSKYLYYILSQNQYHDYMQVVAGGAAQPKLGIYKIERIKVQLPNIDIQNRIVEIMSGYDQAIENNNKRIKILEQMAENLYKEWFVRFRFPEHENAEFENGMPKGWAIKKLSDVSNIIMGQSPESQYYNDNQEGLPFHQGVGSYGEFYLIDDVYSTEGKRIAEPNSIIFSVRAPVGRINISLSKIILGRGVAAINSINKTDGYLLWALKNKFSVEDSIGNGSIFASVTKDELLKQKIIIPNEDLLLRFDDIAKSIEKQIRNIYLSNQNITRQRDLLLPRLMSGKLQV